jgi:hypothetical protein
MSVTWSDGDLAWLDLSKAEEDLIYLNKKYIEAEGDKQRQSNLLDKISKLEEIIAVFQKIWDTYLLLNNEQKYNIRDTILVHDWKNLMKIRKVIIEKWKSLNIYRFGIKKNSKNSKNSKKKSKKKSKKSKSKR